MPFSTGFIPRKKLKATYPKDRNLNKVKYYSRYVIACHFIIVIAQRA